MKGISLIVGQKGSGKTTVLDIINSFGFYTSELSNHIKFLEFEGKMRDDLKDNKWKDSAISLACENGLLNVSGQAFIVGVSRPIEIEYLKRNNLPYEVVSVLSNRDLMYQRILERNRKGEENMSLDRFNEMCERRRGKVIGFEANDLDGLIKLSNYQINNENSLEDLYYSTKRMLNERGHLK